MWLRSCDDLSGMDWTYSLEGYAVALEDSGTADGGLLREPRPTGTSERFRRWERVPLFLSVRAVKTPFDPSTLNHFQKPVG